MEGLAFQRFDDQFNELMPKVKDFAILMEEIKMQLINTAEAMDEQDEALSRNFGFK